MDAMLSKVADFYEEEVDNLVDNLSSLMETNYYGYFRHSDWWLNCCSCIYAIFKMGAAIG